VASFFFFLVHGNYGLLTLTTDYSTSFRPALGYYRHLGPVSEASEVQRHPRSLEMARIDRPYYTSCWWCAVTACLSRTISLILPLLRCTWLPVGGRGAELEKSVIKFQVRADNWTSVRPAVGDAAITGIRVLFPRPRTSECRAVLVRCVRRANAINRCDSCLLCRSAT